MWDFFPNSDFKILTSKLSFYLECFFVNLASFSKFNLLKVESVHNQSFVLWLYMTRQEFAGLGLERLSLFSATPNNCAEASAY